MHKSMQHSEKFYYLCKMYCKIRYEIKENPKVKLKIPKNLLFRNFKLTSQLEPRKQTHMKYLAMC